MERSLVNQWLRKFTFHTYCLRRLFVYVIHQQKEKKVWLPKKQGTQQRRDMKRTFFQSCAGTREESTIREKSLWLFSEQDLHNHSNVNIVVWFSTFRINICGKGAGSSLQSLCSSLTLLSYSIQAIPWSLLGHTDGDQMKMWIHLSDCWGWEEASD